MDPEAQALAQTVNERIAYQIGQLVIANTHAAVKAEMDEQRIAELTRSLADGNASQNTLSED